MPNVDEIYDDDDLVTAVMRGQPIHGLDVETFDMLAKTGIDPAWAAENNVTVKVAEEHPRKKKDLSEEELLKNDLWIQAARIAMPMFTGKDPVPHGGSFVDPTTGLPSVEALSAQADATETAGPPKQLSDAEAAQWGMDMMGWFNYNLPAMGMNTARIQNADPRQKMAMYYLMQMYDDKQMSWDGVWRGVKGVLADPSTYAGLSTLGIGTMVGASVKAATQTSVKAALRASLKPILAGAAEGAAYAGTDDALRQAVKIMAGAQDSFSPVQSAVAGTVGTVAGGGLTAAGASAVPLVRKAVEPTKGLFSRIFGQ